jgi:chemotaxis protein MotB
MLRRMSEELAKIDNPLVIGGHTDARAFARGSHKTNWDLSYERADAARKILEAGALQGRVHRVAAYGSSEPFDRDNPNAASNRRLSIIALRHSKVVSTTPPAPAKAEPAKAEEKAEPTPTHTAEHGGHGEK